MQRRKTSPHLSQAHQAATKLQAIFRGNSKRLKLLKDLENNVAKVKEELENNVAKVKDDVGKQINQNPIFWTAVYTLIFYFFYRIIYSIIEYYLMQYSFSSFITFFQKNFSPEDNLFKFVVIKFLEKPFRYFISLGEKNQQKEQMRMSSIASALKHEKRQYQDTNVIGWNIFNREKDKKGNITKVTFTMPTENTSSLRALMSDDDILYNKVIGALMKPTIGFPDFMMIILDENNNEDSVQDEFYRRIKGKISECLNSSNWPGYAFSKKFGKQKESPIFLVTCEKNDAHIHSFLTRTWLVFPSDLKWLLEYTNEQLDDDSENGIFKVEHPYWRIRFKNLRVWAEFQFGTSQNSQAMMFNKNSIDLPLY